MAGKSLGTAFVEIDLDPSRYTKGQQRLYKDATTTTTSIEANFKKLGIKSSAEMDLMRQKITNSYNMIANSSKATANDILRAERSKNAQLKALNAKQFGHQESLLKKNLISWRYLAAGIIAAIGGAVYSLKQMVAETARTGDMFDKMSLRTGISVEKLSALSYAAKITGTNMATVEKGLRYLSNAMLDMERGMGESKKTFEELGIEVIRSDGKLKETTTILTEVAGKLSKMTDETKIAAYASEIFGARAGTQLVPLLKQGSQGIEELTQKAKELGIVMTTGQAKAAADYTDRMQEVSEVINALKRSIGLELIPFIIDLAEEMNAWAASGGVKRFTEWMEAFGSFLNLTRTAAIHRLEDEIAGLNTELKKLHMMMERPTLFGPSQSEAAEKYLEVTKKLKDKEKELVDLYNKEYFPTLDEGKGKTDDMTDSTEKLGAVVYDLSDQMQGLDGSIENHIKHLQDWYDSEESILLTETEWQDYISQVTGGMDDVDKAVEKTSEKMADDWERAIISMNDVFASLIMSVLRGAGDISDIFARLGWSLAENVVSAGIGSVFGGIGGIGGGSGGMGISPTSLLGLSPNYLAGSLSYFTGGAVTLPGAALPSIPGISSIPLLGGPLSAAMPILGLAGLIGSLTGLFGKDHQYRRDRRGQFYMGELGDFVNAPDWESMIETGSNYPIYFGGRDTGAWAPYGRSTMTPFTPLNEPHSMYPQWESGLKIQDAGYKYTGLESSMSREDYWQTIAFWDDISIHALNSLDAQKEATLGTVEALGGYKDVIEKTRELMPGWGEDAQETGQAMIDMYDEMIAWTIEDLWAKVIEGPMSLVDALKLVAEGTMPLEDVPKAIRASIVDIEDFKSSLDDLGFTYAEQQAILFEKSLTSLLEDVEIGSEQFFEMYGILTDSATALADITAAGMNMADVQNLLISNFELTEQEIIDLVTYYQLLQDVMDGNVGSMDDLIAAGERVAYLFAATAALTAEQWGWAKLGIGGMSQENLKLNYMRKQYGFEPGAAGLESFIETILGATADELIVLADEWGVSVPELIAATQFAADILRDLGDSAQAVIDANQVQLATFWEAKLQVAGADPWAIKMQFFRQAMGWGPEVGETEIRGGLDWFANEATFDQVVALADSLGISFSDLIAIVLQLNDHFIDLDTQAQAQVDAYAAQVTTVAGQLEIARLQAQGLSPEEIRKEQTFSRWGWGSYGTSELQSGFDWFMTEATPEWIIAQAKAFGISTQELIDDVIWLNSYLNDTTVAMASLNDVIRDVEHSITQWQSVVDSISSQISDITSGSASPLSAEQRLEMLHQQRWAMLGEMDVGGALQALETDEERIALVRALQENYMQTLRVAQEAYQLPSMEYQQQYQRVVAGLEQLQAYSQYMVSEYEVQLTQLTALEGIEGNTSDLLSMLTTTFEDEEGETITKLIPIDQLTALQGIEANTSALLALFGGEDGEGFSFIPEDHSLVLDSAAQLVTMGDSLIALGIMSSWLELIASAMLSSVDYLLTIRSKSSSTVTWLNHVHNAVRNAASHAGVQRTNIWNVLRDIRSNTAVGGSFQHGTSYVTKTGNYLLHEGETVGKGPSTITVNIYGATDPRRTADAVETRLEKFLKTPRAGQIVKKHINVKAA